MTVIECTMCGDPKDVVANGVSLPYVCPDCEDAKNFNGDLDAAFANMAKYQEQTVLSEETATAENTVELVRDLQQQLETAQKQVADLNLHAEQLGGVVTSLFEEIVGLNLRVIVSEKWEMHSHSGLAKAMERVDELQDELDTTTNNMIKRQVEHTQREHILESQVETLKSRLLNLEDSNRVLKSNEAFMRQLWLGGILLAQKKRPWYKKVYDGFRAR